MSCQLVLEKPPLTWQLARSAGENRCFLGYLNQECHSRYNTGVYCEAGYTPYVHKGTEKILEYIIYTACECVYIQLLFHPHYMVEWGAHKEEI